MEDTPGLASTKLTGYGPQGEVSKVATSAHGAVDKAAASASEAVSAIRPAIARVADSAHQAVDTVNNIASPAVQWVGEQSDMIAARSRDAVADARAYVIAHPWQSLGTALAVGYLLGRKHAR